MSSFLFKLHQFKHRLTHLINHTPYYFCKCTCVVQNLHTSLALRSTLLKGADVYLSILVTLCLASQ